ncbi:MAG: hypothetical protein FWG39_04170 [Alphaproteobacteria bacterium]|nr:hypothetical protein [Alphaproteobacteria bacterium]
MNQETKIIYIADGTVKQFHFTFPVWQAADVRVMKDGVALSANEYYVSLDDMSENPNFGHPGGSVTLNKMPDADDVITVYRRLKLDRIVSYQPTAPICQSVLNMDLNFVMEVLKDFQSQVGELSDAGNIGELIVEIDALRERLANLGGLTDILDVGQIIGDIANISGALAALETKVDNIDITAPGAGGGDPVVATNIVAGQPLPNPWYRKYSSGWVEQGGVSPGLVSNYQDFNIVDLAVEMAQINYPVTGQLQTEFWANGTNVFVGLLNKTKTSFAWRDNSIGAKNYMWEVKGLAA